MVHDKTHSALDAADLVLEQSREAYRTALDAERSDAVDRARLLTFLVRLPYTLGALGISFWLMARYRRRAGPFCGNV